MFSTITLLDVLVAILIGIPFGLLFPVRPKYLFLDLAAAIIFFPSISINRWFEGTYTGQMMAAGLLYCLFLISAYAATRFNKSAQAKEEIVKSIENQIKE
jgi:hypothetical protein